MDVVQEVRPLGGEGGPGPAEQRDDAGLLGLVVRHVLDHVHDPAVVAHRAEVGLLHHLRQRVGLARSLERIHDLVVVPAQERGVFLDRRRVLLDGGVVLPLLGELDGDLIAERGVVGPKFQDLHQLGAGLVAAVRGLVVVGERLVELHRVGRGRDLVLRPLDQLVELARAGQDLDRRGAGLLGVARRGRGRHDDRAVHGVVRLRRRRRAQDLLGDLHGGVGLLLLLILEHQADERRRLVAGAAAGAAEDRLAQLVQAEPAHLSGQADLGVGVEPQAEQALGGLAGAVEVAGEDRQAEGLVLAALGGGVVQRLDGVDDGQGLGRIPALLQQLGQDQAEVGVGLGAVDGLRELGDGRVPVVVPPEDGAEGQPRDDGVDVRLGRVGELAQVGGQVAGEVELLVALVHGAQQADGLGVEPLVGGREGELDRVGRAALPDLDVG